MPLTESQHSINRESGWARLKSIWQDLRAQLDHRKHQLDEEISSYPTPIPHCDAQFNYLYEQRTRLVQELQRMDTLTGQSLARGDSLEVVKKFLSSPPDADDEAEQRLRARLKVELEKVRS